MPARPSTLLDLVEHFVDVGGRKRMGGGCPENLQLSIRIHAWFLRLCRSERSANPLSNRHSSPPGNGADFLHFTVVQDHLKALTHGDEYNGAEGRCILPRKVAPATSVRGLGRRRSVTAHDPAGSARFLRHRTAACSTTFDDSMSREN